MIRRALICDDDETFRDFVSRVLKLSGWEVEQAEHGEAALGLLERENPFGLIMVDLLMPVRSGWEVIEFLRRSPCYRNTRIIAVTGLAPSPAEWERLKNRNVEILTKDGDFTVERLLQLITVPAEGENRNA